MESMNRLMTKSLSEKFYILVRDGFPGIVLQNPRLCRIRHPQMLISIVERKFEGCQQRWDLRFFKQDRILLYDIFIFFNIT